jgi:putative Mg2+ transporter-C (MgtC) family protein
MEAVEKIWELLKELNLYSAAFRVFLAVLLGGVIGLERGHHGRAAGLRTHILVCLGAAISVMVAVYCGTELGFANDPMRVGAQVASGIGFLGVGTIMVRNREQVTGLNTAAGLWTTACIGLAVGIGFYTAAFLAFFAVIITISILVHLEKKVKGRVSFCCYAELSDVGCVNGLYREIEGQITGCEIIPAKSGIAGHVGWRLHTESIARHHELLDLLSHHQSVVIALPETF